MRTQVNGSSRRRSCIDLPEVLAREGIKRAEGFVHDQHVGLVDDGAAQRGALPHSARKLRRALVLEALQADERQQVPRARPPAARRGIEAATISSGRSTFCRIVRHSSRTGFWNAMPTVLRGPFTFSPCSQTSPVSGFISPAISRVSVDLPQPDGPTTAQNSPSGIAMERLQHRQRAFRRPVGVRDAFDLDDVRHVPAPIATPRSPGPGARCRSVRHFSIRLPSVGRYLSVK
jgi:hypothetical protein